LKQLAANAAGVWSSRARCPRRWLQSRRQRSLTGHPHDDAVYPHRLGRPG